MPDNMVELKKNGLVQVQSGDWKASFTLQSADMPDYLLSAQMGKRFYVVFVDADDYDEQNGKTEQKEIGTNSSDKTEGERLMALSHIKCNEYYFQDYAKAKGWGEGTRTENARFFIYDTCKISSRSEISTNVEAQNRFKELLRKYKDWQAENTYADNLERM